MKGNTVYASARAKALENKLVGKDRICRMLDCKTANDALKILTESGFGDGVATESVLDFEKLVSAEYGKFRAFLKETCPDEKILEYFLLPFDYADAQAFIRAKYLKTDVSAMTNVGGVYERDKLSEKIMKDDYSGLTKNLKTALLKCDNLFVDKKATGSAVDAIFKKALYADLYERSLSHTELKDVFSERVDVTNVLTALKVKDYEKFKTFKLSGGKIRDKAFEYLSVSDETDIEKVKNEKVSSGIVDCLKSYAEGKSLEIFEKYYDDYAVEYFGKELYDTSSVRPYLLYCFYTLSQFKNVRIVMVGLINGLDKDEIKTEVRKGYGG